MPSGMVRFNLPTELLLLCVFFTGWGYEVQEPKIGTISPKSYAANFSWDKKTRVVTK